MLGTPAKRVRVGFSVAIEALVLIAVSLLVSGLDCLRSQAWTIPLGFGLLGAGLLGFGRRDASSSDTPVGRVRVALGRDSGPDGEHPLAFLSKSRYWGWVIMISTVPIIILCQAQMTPAQVAVPQPRARKAIARSEQPPAQSPSSAPELKFPDLKVTGIICNGANSTAVINGLSIAIGKRVENVTLVSVGTSGVVVELNGVKKLIPLGD